MKRIVLILTTLIAFIGVNSCSQEDVSKAIADAIKNSFFQKDESLNFSYGSPVLSELNVTTRIIKVTDIGFVGNLNIKHSRVGDLQITLIKPDGTRLAIARNNGGDGSINSLCIVDSDDYESIATAVVVRDSECYKPIDSFSSIIGENPNGIWKLEIKDTVNNGKNGRFTGWGLSVFGKTE